MKQRITVGLVAVCMMLVCTLAQAGSITYATPSGSTNSGDPVNAQAVFTFGAGTLTIGLTNLETNPKDVGENLSTIIFTTSSSPGTQNSYTSSGLERTVAKNHSFTDNPSAVSTGWVLSRASSTLELDVLSGSGHAGPSHTVIGDPGSATYSNANGSIAGNGPHNPFLYGTPTFTLDFSGFTAGTTLTSVIFQFGTTDGGGQVTGVPVPVTTTTTPEPSSLVLAAVGLFGLRIIICRTSSGARARQGRDAERRDRSFVTLGGHSS